MWDPGTGASGSPAMAFSELSDTLTIDTLPASKMQWLERWKHHIYIIYRQYPQGEQLGHLATLQLGHRATLNFRTVQPDPRTHKRHPCTMHQSASNHLRCAGNHK